jgi:hypothetical protein
MKIIEKIYGANGQFTEAKVGQPVIYFIEDSGEDFSVEGIASTIERRDGNVSVIIVPENEGKHVVTFKSNGSTLTDNLFDKCNEEQQQLEAQRKIIEARLKAIEEQRTEILKQDAQRIEAERIEDERKKAAEKAEAQRIEAERIEDERKKAAEKAEAQRIEAERIEDERKKAAEKAEAQRIEAERIEDERKKAAEKAEAQRIEDERKKAAEKAEAQRIAAIWIEEAKRIEDDRKKTEMVEKWNPIVYYTPKTSFEEASTAQASTAQASNPQSTSNALGNILSLTAAGINQYYIHRKISEVKERISWDGQDLTLRGATTISGALAVTGAETVGGALAVTGATTIGGALTITGLTSITGTLSSTGGIINTPIGASGTASTGAFSTLTSGTATVTGLLTASGGINADNAFTVADATGNTNITGTLNVTGTSELGVLTAASIGFIVSNTPTAVTQLTDYSTGVTITSRTGTITTVTGTGGGGGINIPANGHVHFTVTANPSSLIAAKDVVILSVQSSVTANSVFATVTGVTNGTFTITLTNMTGTADITQKVINYAIITCP